MSGGKVVCVTGGSGYIASWLIKLLLQSGYIVKATVRDPRDPKRTDHLLALDGAKERLHLYKADLLDEGSFDSVIDGCEGVFHTASPSTLDPSISKEDLIDPALKGTINVLKSCVNAGCVKRVILTSSIATVFINAKSNDPNAVVDETWYSEPKFCEDVKEWYSLGKTLAEKAAWDFAKENGIELITLHPSFVLGPLLQPTINFSVEMLLNILKGMQFVVSEFRNQYLLGINIQILIKAYKLPFNLKLNYIAGGWFGALGETFPNAYYRTVDVRDVVDAHIKAFENPSANGRYVLVADITHFSEVLKLVHEQFPNLQVPTKCDNNTKFMPNHEISKEKVKCLGINYLPLEVTLRDTILNFAQRGLVTI